MQLNFHHTSFFSCNDEDESVIEEPPILREVRERTDWEKFYSSLKNGFSNSKPKPNNPEFYANSPFIFLVIENTTGLIFQMGVVKDPSIDTAE